MHEHLVVADLHACSMEITLPRGSGSDGGGLLYIKLYLRVQEARVNRRWQVSKPFRNYTLILFCRGMEARGHYCGVQLTYSFSLAAFASKC